MKKIKKAKPGMARDWTKVERTARRLTSVASLYVNDISGNVTAIVKTGATKEAVRSEFHKIVPPESFTISAKVTDTLKENGWRRLWPRHRLSVKDRIA